MKAFAKYLSALTLAYLLLNVLSHVCFAVFTPRLLPSPADRPVHTLVVGASNAECAFNDSILPGYLNLASGGLWFTANYNSVIWANEYTATGIDTVLCQASLVNFLYYTPSAEADVFRFRRSEKMSLLRYGEFLKVFTHKWVGIKSLLLPYTLQDLVAPRAGGCFLSLERDKLHDPRSADYIKSFRDVYGKDGFTEEVLRRDAKEQVYFLRQIRDYCKAHDIVFVIGHTPFYHISDYVSDRGFRDYLLHEFGPDQLIADYADFHFPDDSYYGDMEHLNRKGAAYLSNHILKHGLSLTTAREYCR